LLPKVLGTILALVNPRLRRGFGGSVRIIASLLIEQIFSTLLAPSMMIFHTTFVITTLAGKPVTWNAQDRGDRGITFMEALNRHKWQILLGIAWGGAILLMAPRYIWWLTPILSGLILSVPLTMLTSRSSVGKWLRRRGLLLTPEESDTPPELLGLEERLASAVTAVAPERPVAIPGISTVIAPPKLQAPQFAATFPPVVTSSGAQATALVKAAPAEAANESMGAHHDEDIMGIVSIANLPARKPLQMEAAAPVYLRPRDALSGLHRLLSAWSA
jgi:hypothetical protein